MAKRRRVEGTRLEHLVETAKGLAHPVRLRILAMLASGEICVCQMTSVLALAPSTVSQHLSVLARGGLVAERKQGKLVFYRLRREGDAAALSPGWIEQIVDDPKARRDRELVTRLRRIPIAELCAAELDLVATRARRTAARAAARPA